MAKYFFDLTGGKQELDDTGIELNSPEAAWEQATLMCGQPLKDMDGDLRPFQEVRLTVSDEYKRPLFSIYFGADRL